MEQRSGLPKKRKGKEKGKQLSAHIQLAMQKKKMQVEKIWAVSVVERSVESAQRGWKEATHKQICIRLDGGYRSLPFNYAYISFLQVT